MRSSRCIPLFRWFIVHVPFVRFMRQLLYVSNMGPAPPPILRLSDGGHIENLGILPLLKKRLRKIVVADGGHKSEDGHWAKDLLKALSLAREKLHCSFIGLDGRDVIEDVKEKFVNKPRRHQPRSYRSVAFEVLFFAWILFCSNRESNVYCIQGFYKQYTIIG